MPDVFVIKDWDDYQHYGKRRPPWIKLYGKLLYNADFIGMPEQAQAQLIKLWVLASQMGHPLKNDLKMLAGKIGTKGKLYMPLFIELGFITQVSADGEVLAVESNNASKMLAKDDEDAIHSRARAPARALLHSPSLVSSLAVQEGVQGEPSPIRQRLMAEEGGEKVLAAFAATVENAEGYLGVVEAAIDGAYGKEFRITPAEAVSALRDWTIKKIENPNPIVLRGFFRAQVRERERVRSSNETAATENMTSAEKILAATQKRPA